MTNRPKCFNGGLYKMGFSLNFKPKEPDEKIIKTTCHVCGFKLRAIIGVTPFCRMHNGFVHADCFDHGIGYCQKCVKGDK